MSNYKSGFDITLNKFLSSDDEFYKIFSSEKLKLLLIFISKYCFYKTKKCQNGKKYIKFSKLKKIFINYYFD